MRPDSGLWTYNPPAGAVSSIATLATMRRSPALPALAVVAALAVAWAALLAAAAVNPGYSHRRDYVSVLAARGVEQPWLGVLGIAAVGLAGLGAGVLVWRLSRAGAAALVAAGVGFVVTALVRIDCPRGAAGCGLGGRFELQGSAEVGHWTAAVASTVLVLAGTALVGAALWRRGRGGAAAASLAASAVTLAALLGTGGDAPGTVQRIWIVAMSLWLLGVAASARRASTRS